MCAVHLINRMPLQAIYRKVPYELLYRNKPNYNHLRAFGCLCFVSTSNK